MFGIGIKSFEKKWRKLYDENYSDYASSRAGSKLHEDSKLSREKRAVLISVIERGVLDNYYQSLWHINWALEQATHLEIEERVRLIGLIDNYLDNNPNEYNAFSCAKYALKSARHLTSGEQSLLVDIFEKGMGLKSKKANNYAVAYAANTLKEAKTIDNYDRARLERVSKKRPKAMEGDDSAGLIKVMEDRSRISFENMLSDIKKFCDLEITDSLYIDRFCDDDQQKIVRLIFTAEQNSANKAGVLTAAGAMLEHGLGVGSDGRKMLISLIDRLSASIPDLGFMWACNALNKTKHLEDHQQKKLETIAVALLDHRDDTARNNVMKTCANFIANNGSFENEKLNKAFARSMLNHCCDKKPPVNNRSITKNVR